mmetsp:Transcript_66407/g.210195  ORF Transcript_66407/g.210195 Transcript_66407/m.210195 type:complete len:358 (-) Transcript_66407:226-1299(-)
MTYYAHSSEGICKGYKQFGKAGRVADRLKSPDLLAEWLSNSFVARQKHLPNVSDVKVLEWKGKLTEKLRECNILPRPNSLCWSQLKDNSMCHLGGPCVCQSGDTGEGEISDINKQTILPFKGIHLGRKAILLASGPTLDAFFTSKVQSLLNHSIVVGVKALAYSSIHLDYLFNSDAGSLQTLPDTISRQVGIQKFFAAFRYSPSFGPAGSSTDVNIGTLIRANATIYEANHQADDCIFPFVRDVGNRLFGSSTSTVFMALQFILYTGVNEVVLVGCDAGMMAGHRSPHSSLKMGALTDQRILRRQHRKYGVRNRLLVAWNAAKAFVDANYPCTNVTVINPVGLKGLGWNEYHTENFR